MALFRRNKTDAEALPPELTEYYQAEQRERTWVAWLLAAGTLVVTVAVILGLFFGGRWIYRKAHHTNNTASTAQPQTDNGTGSNQSTTSTNPAPSSSSSSSSSSATSNSGSQTSGQSSTGSTSTSGSSSSTGSQTTPTSQPSSLVNTGPGNTIAVFAVASLAGYLIHRRIFSRN